MGTTISQEAWERLQKLEREGRRCQMDSCRNRATVETTNEVWPYERDKQSGQPGEVKTMVFCRRHAAQTREGRNFRELSRRDF